ncbi:MAG: ComF family protein [Clostridia bacterium]|nr:ComF family protein [Clostridia bacterium]
MDFKSKLNSIKKNLLWLMFTNHCKYCNALIGKNEELCEDCRENLPRIIGEKCKFCGVAKERCNCKKHKRNFDGITAPFYYERGIKESIKLLKFNGKTHLAYILGDEMSLCIQKDFEDVNFDFVCFVPFSNVQKIERDYNQSEWLAERIAQKLEIPLEKALMKIFDVKTQHDMPIQQRKGNIYGIYDVDDRVDLKGKTILLVDDIMTTGETLNNCALIMKIRGAEKVYCTTAAITVKKKK